MTMDVAGAQRLAAEWSRGADLDLDPEGQGFRNLVGFVRSWQEMLRQSGSPPPCAPHCAWPAPRVAVTPRSFQQEGTRQ